MNEYIIRRSSTNARTDEDREMSMMLKRVQASDFVSATTLAMDLVEVTETAYCAESLVAAMTTNLLKGDWERDGIRYTITYVTKLS